VFRHVNSLRSPHEPPLGIVLSNLNPVHISAIYLAVPNGRVIRPHFVFPAYCLVTSVYI
jgi:hypothetical protein